MILKESETIEFKKSTAELKEAVISAAAMLNKQGFGTIYFGISDNGTVHGQSVGRNTLKQITQTIVDNIEPKIYPTIEEILFNGVTCIKVDVKGINSPYFAYGKAYIRVGESDKSLIPEGLQPEDYFSGLEHSVLRNPLIAEAMFRSRDIERWGSGIKRINDECTSAGIKVDFKKLKTGFVVIFHRLKWQKELDDDEKTTQKTTQKTTLKTDQRIILLLKEHPSLSRKELASVMGDITIDGVKYHLSQLIKKGLIKHIGPAKGGHWEVTGG